MTRRSASPASPPAPFGPASPPGPPGALRSLRPGDTVAVVAPAGPARPEQLPRVAPLFARFGLEARLYPSCQARHPAHDYLAGDDDVRLADLHAALADDEVRAVFCLRGGYGCTRLLERIDAGLVRAQRHKPLVGYSDVTALHALWQCEGAFSVHAPMPTSDLLHDEAGPDVQALFALLMPGAAAGSRPGAALEASSARSAPTATPQADAWHCHGRDGAVATGRLVGGNLSLVAALSGTPWQVDARGAILFLEDVDEDPYRIDRMLVQLRQAGVLQAAAGFLLGSFNGCGDARPVLRDHLGALGTPLLGGWPSGHGRPNRPLVLGARVTLDVAAATLQYEEAPFATGAG